MFLFGVPHTPVTLPIILQVRPTDALVHKVADVGRVALWSVTGACLE